MNIYIFRWAAQAGTVETVGGGFYQRGWGLCGRIFPQPRVSSAFLTPARGSVSSPRPDPEGGAVTTEREWGGAEIYMKTTGNNG